MSSPIPLGLPKYDLNKNYCASCNKTTTPNNAPLLKCSGCKSTFYCERSCQKTDYKYHKHLCKKIGEFIQANPREKGQNACIILKFPDNSSTPELIWWSNSYKLYNGDAFPGIGLDSSEQVVKWLRVQYPRERKYVLDHELQLYFRPKFLFDGSAKNQAMKRYFGKDLGHDWRGDIYVARYARMEENQEANTLQDFQAADLRVLADCFRLYGKVGGFGFHLVREVGGTCVFSDQPTFYPGPETRQAGTGNDAFEEYKGELDAVMGVNVTSLGDRQYLKKPTFVKHRRQEYLKKPTFVKHRVCASTHPIYCDRDKNLTTTNKMLSSISLHIDIPLLVRKHGFFNQGWPTQTNPHSNPNARFMHRAAENTDKDFGPPHSIEWNEMVGTVLVVRLDKKPITPQQVEAFSMFCDQYWRENIKEMDTMYEKEYPSGHTMHQAIPDMEGKKELLERTAWIQKYLKRANFEKFFGKVKIERIQSGDLTWVGAISPYAV
ncbi:hypothetical protein HYFRA_00004223 [Hymenoscyphus fraxineus]|uniref:MYND-type domain-containing protein n=1 Tax=Hymenoscyphus fraxineus TaxID=746836 RepID=A0A9N9PND6_9HELO|nr:hypothetical protein HYFRA_00004223 [Hymenoscyphus fraxineus]